MDETLQLYVPLGVAEKLGDGEDGLIIRLRHPILVEIPEGEFRVCCRKPKSARRISYYYFGNGELKPVPEQPEVHEVTTEFDTWCRANCQEVCDDRETDRPQELKLLDECRFHLVDEGPPPDLFFVEAITDEQPDP